MVLDSTRKCPCKRCGDTSGNKSACPEHKETREEQRPINHRPRIRAILSHFSKDHHNTEKVAERMHNVVQYHEYCALVDLRPLRADRIEWPKRRRVGWEKRVFCLANRFRVCLSPIGRAASVHAIDKRLADQQGCLFGLHVAWKTSTNIEQQDVLAWWTVVGARPTRCYMARYVSQAEFVLRSGRRRIPRAIEIMPEQHLIL